MIKIGEIKEQWFDDLDELNEWVREQEVDIKPINVQRIDSFGEECVDEYILFYGEIINEG